MRAGIVVVVVSALFSLAAPAGARSGAASCGAFKARSFTGDKVHIRVSVYTGPVSCHNARRVLRYSITHREQRGNVALGSPKGWNCVRGGPGLFPNAAGYSCEANRPRRVVTGRFLQN
jgi:hypothetical protein